MECLLHLGGFKKTVFPLPISFNNKMSCCNPKYKVISFCWPKHLYLMKIYMNINIITEQNNFNYTIIKKMLLVGRLKNAIVRSPLLFEVWFFSIDWWYNYDSIWLFRTFSIFFKQILRSFFNQCLVLSFLSC